MYVDLAELLVGVHASVLFIRGGVVSRHGMYVLDAYTSSKLLRVLSINMRT